MNELPDFLRTEVWHPFTVHLPLVILLLATILYLSGFIGKRKSWADMGKILLLIGTAGAWVAVYTGNLADSIVARTLCDPTVLLDHENAAHNVAWLFTIASIMVIIDFTGITKKIQKIVSILIIAVMLTGSGFLVYTGHLGSQLVYQQAAGVYTPGEDCGEFKEE